MKLTIELDREEVGRWIAEAIELPGRPHYGFTFHDQDEIGPRMLARIAKHQD